MLANKAGWAVVGVLLAGSAATAQEAVAKSRIVSIGLFKNGLAVVKRAVEVPGPGAYRLEAAAEPVHGTFWIESNAKVDASVKMRDVESTALASDQVNFQHDLGGKKVIVHFKSDKRASIAGVLVKLQTPIADDDDGVPKVALRGGERFLILQTPKSRLFISPSEVAMIEAEGVDEKVTQRRPVLVLNVAKGDEKPTVFVSYLAHGIAWAPSYRVDITDPKKLSIEMAAVVRNELADFDDAELKLISGFSSVEFASVTSPLAPRANWARFFQEISSQSEGGGEGVQRQLLLSNSIRNNYRAIDRLGAKLAATPAGEGVDLHYQDIGKRGLLKGEAFSLTIGKTKADYERLVEWTVGSSPAARKHVGAVVQDEMWDVLRFKNPFSFPMTTAPAMVVEKGRFNGQRTSFWTNVGEETNLRITRSLSLRTFHQEQEDSTKSNERVVVDDRNYTKIHLKGEVVVSNHRNEPTKVLINQKIRGAIQQIEGSPVVATNEDTLVDVNRGQSVRWTVALQPGEERRLSYRYSVLVLR